VLRGKGYVLIAVGENAVVYYKDDLKTPVFMAKFMGNLLVVLAKVATERSLVTVNMPSDHESQEVTVNMSSNDHVNKQRENQATNQTSNQVSDNHDKQRENQQAINQTSNQVSDNHVKQRENQTDEHVNKRRKLTPAQKTFAYWHKSLGHSSNVQHGIYQDGSLIPPIPDNFTCESCIIGKSTNSVPTELPGNKTTRAFELIYSDLSGKQPVPSYGNLLYYITFIDDFSCIA